MWKLLVAMLVVSAWTGSASAKPKIAVLGLEVVVPGTKADPESVRIAKEITQDLRRRAVSGGAYVLAPNSDHELLDEKLANGCDNEALACMAAIGQRIGADALIYGKLERKSTGGLRGYQLSIKLLDANYKAMMRTSVDFVPLADATSPDALQPWVRKAYNRITGVTGGGALKIHVENIDRGTLYIDGEPRGTLARGRIEIAELAEGRYKLAIEAEGYPRWEKVIDHSEPTLIETELQKGPAPGTTARGSRGCGCDASSAPPAGTVAIWLAMLGLWRRRSQRA
jgi:MYXO-CTERM domain-containing protein